MTPKSFLSRFAMRCADFATHARLLRVHNAEQKADPSIGPHVSVLNREFKFPEDGYIQIVPEGEFRGVTTDGDEIMQVLDKKAMIGMAKSFNAEALVNYEHFAHDSDKETRAGGWMQDVVVREDGLYAKIRWTNRAKDEIEGGEYRYISPEFEGFDIVEDGAVKRLRPLKLTGAGLTNKPALKTLKPLSNRETQPNKTTMDDKTKKLMSLLGLSEGASETEIQAAYNRAQSSLQAATTAAAENEKLKADLKAKEELLLNRDLAEFADVIGDKEEDKADAKALFVANRDSARRTYIKQRNLASKNPGGPTVYNRGDAKDPDGNQIMEDAAKEQAAQEAFAISVRNRANELSNANPTLGLGECYNRARSELAKTADSSK